MDREDPTRFGRNAEDADLALSAGEKVGPYQIEGILGAGGMGKVYRALDPRLGRHVAVKFLAGPYAAGTVALERFQREARAISALNHPNVCTIYDIGEDRHGPFLVMELLEGQTLKQRVAAGRCSNEEIIAIGLQVSDALEAAHSQGIVHRDIKPANVFITKQGIAKILDFGLAKSISRAARGAVGLHLDDVTLGETLTKSDATLGTVAYMSPEQARGDDVDARTDLFSFGVVLYEMACGALPFPGDTWAVTFDAILNKQPRPIRERNREIASEISQIIDKALEKERSVRYQTAADIQADLRRAKRNMESAAVAVAVPQAPSRRLPWVVLLALLIVVGIGAVLLYRPNSSVTSPSEYVQITNFPDSAVAPSLSPDGKMVAFIRGGDWFLSRGQIYVKLLSGGESRRLTNDSDVKYGPVFTPDNSRVAFTRLVRTGNGTSWDTWTVPVLGGEPTSFLPNASGLIWTDSRDVIFSKIMGAGLHMGIVSSTETRSDEREIYYPSHERAMAHFSYASPDHKSVLLVEMDRTAQWQPCRLVPADGSNAGKPVGPQGACTAAAWSPDGKWMYFSTFVDGASHLWRQKFPDGTPQQLTFGPTEEEGIALAPDGESIITSLGLRHREIWIHESGGDRRISAEGFPSMPRMSADGKRVYYLLREKSASSSNELLSYDVQTGKVEKILAGLSIVDYDISSDQQQVAFTTRTGNEPPEIWLAFVDRRMPPRKIATAGDEVSFGPKGVLIFRLLEEKANYLGRINEDGSGRERISKDPILNKGYVSPGGDWTMALVSAIDGNTSVESVAIPLDGGPPRLICAATCPAGWSPDGRMFFVGQGTATGVDMGKVLTFPIAPGATLPNLPETGIDLPRNSNPEPPMLGSVSPGPGLTTYAFSKNDIQRNLFRIPLH
jgi:serine/threonine protein kinase